MSEPTDIDALIAEAREHWKVRNLTGQTVSLLDRLADALENARVTLAYDLDYQRTLEADRSEASQLSHQYRNERDRARKVAAVSAERERVAQSNDVAGIVFDEHKKAFPDLHPVLDLRYGIADALWDAGYRHAPDWDQIINALHVWEVHDGNLGRFSRGLHLLGCISRGGTVEGYGRPDSTGASE